MVVALALIGRPLVEPGRRRKKQRNNKREKDTTAIM